jgi:amidase
MATGVDSPTSVSMVEAGADPGLREMTLLLQAREISSRELVGTALVRAEHTQPTLNAFRVIRAEEALAEAEEADRRLAAGEGAPLLGVPVAIKDDVDLTGHTSPFGCGGGRAAVRDAEAVRRLREAGAIVIGKTLLPELAICGFTESATWGVSRNPWDPQRTPGGSSGGSAAAVAAGLVPIASASDGAGSIRIPAASCGLFGLKPQRGRVSMVPHLEHWNGLSANGCVSRTVEDTALWLDVVSGGSPEPGAPEPPQRPFVEAAKSPPGTLRVAYSTAVPRALAPPTVSDQVKDVVAEMAAVLSGLGHAVTQRDPEWGSIGNNSVPRYLHGIAEDVERVPLPARLERRTRAMGRLGALLPAKLFAQARAAAETDGARVNAIFDDHDVLMTPVMGGTALPVKRW